ncbi:MAG TPA: hypothetical protein EYP60_02080 [bacterium (Candidatus Stahlbacteria)]|nr:hypothetical protein [Candidatus Stahlbacteria bacterium]
MEKILQIIDVNLNRVREGLRVCEEIARFVLKDKNLTKEIKDERHRLTEIFAEFEPSLVKHRNSLKDIGLDKEFDKLSYKDTKDIALSNIKRCEEGMRVLEEFSKTLRDEIPPKLKEIRFKLYDIEKRMHALINGYSSK